MGTQDYADAPVPDGSTVHGLQIALVITGIGMTLPMFNLGTQINSAQGLKETLAVAFLACGLVALLDLFTSVVGARCRLSTYQVLAFSFGSRGAQLVNVMLAIMLLGWFATTAQMLGDAVHQAVSTLYGLTTPKWCYTVVALSLMTLTGIFGFQVMERFVRVTVPVLTALMFYLLWLSISRLGIQPALAHPGDHTLSSIDALSSIIGAIILTAVLAPDLTRYARNDRNALFSVLGVAVGFPAALILAAIPAAIHGARDLVGVTALLGIPGLAIVVLVISTWTSNTSNLYSATLTLATLFRRTSTRLLGLGGAAVALVAALGGIADYFIPLLIVLGIVSAPLAGVYVMDFFVLRGGRPYAIEAMNALPAFRASAILAWALGSAVGLIGTYWGHSLTRIPALDSILVAALGHLLMNGSQWLRHRDHAVARE